MPTAYLQKVADEQGIALTKLEEYWDKAKEIAKKHKDAQGEDYWKYTMGIFKNIFKNHNLSESKVKDSHYEKRMVTRVQISISSKAYKTIIYAGVRPKSLKSEIRQTQMFSMQV